MLTLSLVEDVPCGSKKPEAADDQNVAKDVQGVGMRVALKPQKVMLRVPRNCGSTGSAPDRFCRRKRWGCDEVPTWRGIRAATAKVDRAENVNEFGPSANCGERKQAPRIRVSH